MSDNNYQEVIKNNKLFDGIPPHNLKIQLRNEQIIRKKEGEIIFQKGDESRNTFLVIAGRVKLKIYIENKSIKLNKSINDFFGEIEVLEETFRRSAAVANTDCILYALTKADLRSILTDIPEINDNIIAYNRVEIPELQITIQPGLLKADTDKLYITPPPEISVMTAEPKNMPYDEDKPVYKNNGDVETSEELIPGTEGDLYKELPDEEPEDNIAQAEDLESSEIVLPPAEPEIEIIETGKTEDIFIEEETEKAAEDIFPEKESAENIEELSEAEETALLPDEIIPDVNDTVDEFTGKESVEEQVKDIGESAPSQGSFSGSETAGESEMKWINLNSTETKEEKIDALSDDEKFRSDAEEEKLKYDDTEIHSERILESIRKINSSLDKHTIYSNIVREAVKLTEAQTGTLYRVDLLKNQLIGEQETEDGFIDVRYPVSSGLTGLAAETGEIINVREPLKDFRYSEDVDSIRGITGSSMLCVPVKDDKGDSIAVICLANSSTGKFSISDEEKISGLVPHISQTLQFLAGINTLIDENKNTYLSTLTRFITDNIQTPVLTMKYYAGQIRKKSVPQDVRTVLSVLMDQADAVVDFLHSTLAFTENRNPLEIKKCSLQEVMDDTLGLLAEYVESRNVGLYKKVESNISVKLDKKAFYQACLQIARNACDAMGENGNIYITAKQSGDLVNIEFRDTGPGIPDEIKPHIFQPFKSFNKENGTGLGLTIAQRIIRDHGGELTVESSPEKGATFIISLPVFDQV